VIPQDIAGPILNGVPANLPEIDPEETADWLQSLDGVLAVAGPERARYLMLRLLERARERRLGLPHRTTTDFVNTIPAADEPDYPGDRDLERGFRRLVRWNAAMMVHRAQRPGTAVGGHLDSFASTATLHEVGWNHFFRGKDHPGGGDQVFFQAQAAPGVYARAYLEGRLPTGRLDGFRQQKSQAPGLPAYPHPSQAPDFWEFPTASLGLGPLNAVYQASVNRYLENRGLRSTAEQRVWAFVGDGELDEPEARGPIRFAAQEGLDNLVFVVNCNLQRFDGPVRGNGKVVQELEDFFAGAGWNVIKVVWGSGWDDLLAADTTGALVNLMNTLPDGDVAATPGRDGAFIRKNFFGLDPRTAALVEDWSDDRLWRLARGGHDERKVYAAYDAATRATGAPTVVLAHSLRGYFLGSRLTGRMATGQMKRLTVDELKDFRDRLELPIPDAAFDSDPYAAPFYHPGPEDDRIRYAVERRRRLGGFVPERRDRSQPLAPPRAEAYEVLAQGSGQQKASTAMAWAKWLREVAKDKEFGARLVPIIADEARALGLDPLFSTIKIYNPHGQTYTPADSDQVVSYRESTAGQILHTGVNEAGSVAAFTAVGTAYATFGLPLVPMYVVPSMFGFQRTGDGLWAAADQLARGFVIGTAAGKTASAGEGAQHADGHSPLLAATNPAVRHFDPAYGYELAHILRHGLETMFGPKPENAIFYLTLYNEAMVQPPEPPDVDVDGILRGLYLLRPGDATSLTAAPRVQLLASGVAVPWALEAQRLLRQDAAVVADVWSVTSWNELRRDGEAADADRLRGGPGWEPHVAACLKGRHGPVVAVSDFARAVPDQIAPWVAEDFSSLGADGFGFSDTRPAARRWHRLDAPSIVVKVLQRLAATGQMDAEVPPQAYRHYRLDEVPAVAGKADATV